VPFFRRETQQDIPVAPNPAPEETSFPPWALSSILTWLAPFFHGAGPDASGYAGDGSSNNRNFLREIERNLRLTLNWRNGERSALESLNATIGQNPEVLVQIVDYALRHPMMGYSFQDYNGAVAELDRALTQSGSVWCVRSIPQRTTCHLERRVDPGAAEAAQAVGGNTTRDSEHLRNAWHAAYGQSPNPGEAYLEAVKAVEVVAIPVVP
jgi:hypothetical protein